jgi:hypothetical protein
VSEGVDATPTGMVFNERVMDYTVTTLRNDVVDYRRVLRLTTVSGQQLFLAFPDVPPADWLQFPDAGGPTMTRAPRSPPAAQSRPRASGRQHVLTNPYLSAYADGYGNDPGNSRGRRQ